MVDRCRGSVRPVTIGPGLGSGAAVDAFLQADGHGIAGQYQATGELIGAYGLADVAQAKLVRREDGQPAVTDAGTLGNRARQRRTAPR